MEQPKVKKGEWITIGETNSFDIINGYIIYIHPDESLTVGYCQDGTKAIKSDVVWSINHWDFKYSSPDGSYLHGSEECIVKMGRYRKT